MDASRFHALGSERGTPSAGRPAPRRSYGSITLALIACSACAALEPSATNADSTSATPLTAEPAGFPLTGARASGRVIESAAFAGASLRGATLDALAVRRGALVATLRGRTLRPRELVGLSFGAHLAGGDSVQLVVYDVTPRSGHAAASFYKLAHLDAAGWRPVCEGANDAMVSSGVWDHRQGVAGGGAHSPSAERFTLACRGAAIAQCVELGYAPWRRNPVCRSGEGCQSLAALHQACVRLHRADYCGDGRSWTKPGIFVNLYDGFGIQEDTEAWQPEAEWNEHGALCIASPRVAIDPSAAPACAKPRAHPLGRCTDRAHLRSGTLLINEIPATIARMQ